MGERDISPIEERIETGAVGLTEWPGAADLGAVDMLPSGKVKVELYCKTDPLTNKRDGTVGWRIKIGLNTYDVSAGSWRLLVIRTGGQEMSGYQEGTVNLVWAGVDSEGASTDVPEEWAVFDGLGVHSLAMLSPERWEIFANGLLAMACAGLDLDFQVLAPPPVEPVEPEEPVEPDEPDEPPVEEPDRESGGVVEGDGTIGNIGGKGWNL